MSLKLRSIEHELTALCLILTAVACGKVASVSEESSPLGAVTAVSLVEAELNPIVVETPYKEVIKTLGGQPPFKFEVLGGALPEGLALETSSGILSGQVPRSSVNKTSSITVMVTDSLGTTAQQTYGLDVSEYSFTIAPEVLPDIVPGAPFLINMGAIGAQAPLRFSVSGTLPPGLTLNEKGELATSPEGLGQSQQNTTWNFQILCSDANGVSAVKDYELKLRDFIGRADLTIVSENLPSPAAGTAYAAGIAVSGGKSPYQFALRGGTLPSGLSLEQTSGSLSGNVAYAAAGTLYDFTIEVTDAAGIKRERRFQGAVDTGNANLVIHSATIVNPTAGTGYSSAIAVTGGAKPYTFALDSGTLPLGLTLNTSTGVISGTVDFSKGGDSYNFVLRVSDSVGASKTANYSGTIASGVSSLSIDTSNATLPIPVAGNLYSAVISAQGGKAPYTYTIITGAVMPNGLTTASMDSSTGVISGSINYAAKNSVYSFTVRVTDSVGQTDTELFTGTVSPYMLTMYPTTLGAADPNHPYTATVITVGGQGPYSYAVTSGSLSSGLSLNGFTGAISGIVADNEQGLTKNFTITVTDGLGTTGSRSYAISTGSFAISMSTVSLTTANEGSAYTQTLAATGGTAPYTYEYTGTLPSGIGLQNNGIFFGTPATGQGSTSGNTFNITIRAKDSLGRYSLATPYTLTVGITAPSISIGTPGVGVLGTAYTHTISASGGRSPYAFSINSGSLPTGISLNAAGVISGVPTSTAACPAATFTVLVTDSSTPTPQTATRTMCISAVDGIVLSDSNIATIVRNQAYTRSFSAIGGSAPYTYTASNLPLGLSLMASTGELSGSTPVAAGTYTAYVTVTDGANLSTTRSVQLTVAEPLGFQSIVFSHGGAGSPYQPVSVIGSGGVAPYTYSLVSGALPPGLSLSSNGLISGTLSANAAVGSPYAFTVRVSDNSGLTANSSGYQIVVTTAPTITTKRLETTVSGAPYSKALKFSGGIPPYNFSASGLPAGLSIHSTSGVVNGSTTVVGNHNIAVTITDTNGLTSTKNVSLTVNAGAKTLRLFGQRFSDPCPQTIAFNCDPRGYQVGKLVNAQPNTKYVVYSANISPGTLAVPVPRIYIARLDSEGRIPTPGTSVFSSSITPSGYVTAIEIADIDLDGHLDIIAAVYGNSASGSSRLTVFWNDGTIDGNGMPQFTTSNDFGTATFTNRVSSIRAVNMRNGSYANTTDIIAVDWRHDTPANSAKIVAFMGTCTNNCSGSRATALPTAPATVYNTTLTNGRTLYYVTNVNAGKFNDTQCKSIVVSGSQDNALANSWLLVRRQDKVGGVCQGTFNSAMELSLGNSTLRTGSVAVADFNNDGYDDMATVAQNAATARVVIMDSSGGGFTGSVVYSPALLGVGAEIAPYCLDGSQTCPYPGLVVVGGRKLNYTPVQGQGGSGYLSFLPNAAGTFEDGTGAQRIDYVAPIGIGQEIITTPLISNNKNDIMIMGYDNYGIPFHMVYENNAGTATYPLKQMTQLKSLPDDFGAAAEVGKTLVGDIDGDDIPDMVSYLVNQQAIVTHQGPLDVPYGISPSFFSAGVQHGLHTPWHQQHAMALEDIDNDGDLDIVLAGATSRSLALMVGDGSGMFASPVLYNAADGDQRPYAVAVADVNGDGFLDIVTTSDNSGGTTPILSILSGRGDGTFSHAVPIASGTGTAQGNVGCSGPRNILLHDLDLDGRPEIILGCYTNAQIVVFRRHTDGTWKKNNSSLAVSGSNGTAIAIGQITPGDSCYSVGADFVGRPCVDLVIGQYAASAGVRILSNFTLGTPSGTGTFNVNFTANTTVNFYGYVHDVEIADFDQDGLSDYVVAMASQNTSTSHNGQSIKICRGNGTGGCLSIDGTGMDLPLLHGVSAVDFDNDGMTDLIATSRTGQRIPFLMIGRYRNISH